MAEVTPDQVENAYRALHSGDRAEIARHYDEDVSWLVPGSHELAGWYHGLDAFLDMMTMARKLTGGTFTMEPLSVMTGEDCSADVCRNRCHRAGSATDSASPYDDYDGLVFHFAKWRDGRIVEGRDGLFGDDATAFNQFWTPMSANGQRYLPGAM